MKHKQIANKLTGFSCPIFGISWEPPILEQDIAKEVINFLEDKRVLYNPYYLEDPSHCKDSVIEIRKFITERLEKTDRNSYLGENLRAIRAACRKFLDITQDSFIKNGIEKGVGNQPSMRFNMEFYSGMGELRSTIGVLVGKLVTMYGFDCEDGLASIIPLERNK